MVISLPGYEAGPNTPLEGVSFDSDTPLGGLVLARGIVVDTSSIAQDNIGRTYETTFDLSCPNLRAGYGTFLFLTYTAPDTADGRQGISVGFLLEAQYLDDATLRIKRQRYLNDIYWRFADYSGNDVRFMVLAS
ncbi:hypothetical protein [Aurantimonas sp. 22II-16-19i]|uniref:hypothetical protein n=1 Tax=Aurantimonas sp. 22II-16-19i TaxID=1317114 RepID=UPI00111BF165|nr:hypothetical protein [Aurantimonas sp. 22II-16-19i]